MPIDCISPSITPYPLNFAKSPDMDIQPASRPANTWSGNRICKDVSDPDPNCCCDGYSIESVIDQSYEYGLGDHPEVKNLEKYPCMTCLELDSIVEELALLAWAKEDPKEAEQKQKKISDRVFDAIMGFIKDEKVGTAE